MMIEVVGKSFKVEKFCNKATRLFNEMMKLTTEFSGDKEDAKSVMTALEGTTSLIDKALELVEIVLRTNKVKFDLDFWEEQTSVQDLIGFLTQAYQVEVDESVKKNQTQINS